MRLTSTTYDIRHECIFYVVVTRWEICLAVGGMTRFSDPAGRSITRVMEGERGTGKLGFTWSCS